MPRIAGVSLCITSVITSFLYFTNCDRNYSLRITVAFLRTFVIMVALYTKCLFSTVFFFTTDESQSRNPFCYSKSFQCHTVLITLGLKVLPLRQFDLSYDTISSATSFGLQQILELFLDFCVKVNNENLESETDFWEILAVLLLAWYLPFSFCYFCMWSAHHTPHWFLYQILFSPDELLIFCLAQRVISKCFS